MRLALFLSVAAFAVSAAAQESSTGQAPAEESSASGLSGLSDTVDDLTDDPSQPSQPSSEAPAATGSSPPEPPAPQPEASAVESRPTTSPPGTVPPPINAAQRAEIADAVLRGRQLFAIARAGMLATQDMLSRVADPEAAGIKGWIAEPEGNAMAVTFYADGEAGPAAAYRVQILGGRAVSRETFLTGGRPSLTGIAERMARARAASESEDQRACTDRPFNVLVVPPATADAPVLVYRFSTPESASVFPLGGHFRSTVAADQTVSEARAFTHGCLNVNIGEVPAGAQAGPIALTHLLDPLPTEAHVFLSLLSGRPLVVAAGDPTRLFMVAGDSIREIRR